MFERWEPEDGSSDVERSGFLSGVVLAIRKLAYLLHPDAFDNPPDAIPWGLGRIRQ